MKMNENALDNDNAMVPNDLDRIKKELELTQAQNQQPRNVDMFMNEQQ